MKIIYSGAGAILHRPSGDLPRVFDIVNGFLIDAVAHRVMVYGPLRVCGTHRC